VVHSAIPADVLIPCLISMTIIELLLPAKDRCLINSSLRNT